MDVGAWLRGLGLDQYEAAFRDNDVDADVLPVLTANDLIGLGVTSIRHRRKLLAACATLPVSPVRPAASSPEAERRQLTVMFVDLVGSTALSARFDPEDIDAVLRTYLEAVAGEVTRFEGHVAKFIGDGVLAYFGWPRTHEDEAERAVRAGLATVKAVGRLRTPDSDTLAARVGIATGLVVVGDLVGEGDAREVAAVGETPNLAARLQQLAEPGTIVIADGTRRLLGGVFDLVDLGGAALRGFPEPVRAWRVAGERHDAASRFEARRATGLTPLVGREHELALLLDRWRLARDGEGRAVLLTGEPGVGKSRLAEALGERLVDEPHARLLFQCSPQHAGTALHPFIAQLEHVAGLRHEDEARMRPARLEALLAETGGDVTAVTPMLAALLGIPAEGRYPPQELLPQQRKERTLEALLAYIEAIAARRPLLLVFEDLHWIDPTSLELLRLLLGRVPDLPVLAILTARPEFTPPWTAGAQVMPLPLNRLLPRQVEALAQGVSGKALPPELLSQIVARTDGVPLFVEELTRTVLEAGLLKEAGDRYVLDEPLPSVAIPTSLQDSLMARLDRLGPAKEVAQLAACLGREFTYGMLAALAATAAQNVEQLRIALNRLAGSGLVVCDGEPPAAAYSFRHALVQEAAYGSLLKSRRRKLHAWIASTVERRFPDIVELQPEWLAHHHTEAGQAKFAAEHWLRAARRAKDAYANREAQSHLRRCLTAVAEAQRASGGAASDLDRHELEALVLLGDLASLAGDLGEANRWYEQALAIASEPQTRSGIERKRHRPRTAFRDGARIAFYEHGSGPATLLFVAPLAYGLATFQPIVERLCQEFRVVTIDSRGTGASDPLVRPYPLSEHVKDVRTVIDTLGGGPVIGVGLSRGGNLLLKLAHIEPRLFAKLVTIGCSPGPPGQFFSEEYLREHRRLVDKGDLEAIVRFHTSLVFSEPATRELRELFVRTRLELPSETMLSFFDPDPTVEVTPILGEIAVPVLVTHGSVDRLILLEAAELIRARVPDARFYVFEGKGHLPLFTATDEFCEVLRGFAQTGTFAPSEAEVEARR